MNTIVAVAERITTRHRVLLTVLAIGLGVTLPRIFHLFGLGHFFLPMFLPIVLLGSMLSIPFLLSASVVTPFLSTILFGMPMWTVTPVIAVQLTIVGTMQWLLRQTKLPVWTIAPASILTERMLTIGTALLIPSLGISSAAILASYPGVILISVAGILVGKIYGR
jgi:hypothetical protein